MNTQPGNVVNKFECHLHLCKQLSLIGCVQILTTPIMVLHFISFFVCLFSRLYQLSKMYLFTPSGGLYGCPLSMTDGAAKSLLVCVDVNSQVSLGMYR